MAVKSIYRLRNLTLGAVVLGAVAVGAMSFAADDMAERPGPSQHQSEAMAQLLLPPAPSAFALSGPNVTQDELLIATDRPWAPPVQDCVARLDAYIEPLSIPFQEADAQIMAENALLLSHIAALMESCDGAHLLIAGHASGSSDDLSNLALSWERADETLNLLVTLGVDPASLEAIGYGARAPIAEGSDDDDGLNRRVDFRVLNKRN